MSEPTFKLHVLPAGVGDALVLEYGDGSSEREVVVDGGIPDSAEALGRFLSVRPQPELMVVTHIDNDHIGGILSLLESSDTPAPAEIWFDAYRHLPTSRLEQMGPVEGERLTRLIVDRAIPWNVAFDKGPVMITAGAKPPVRKLGGGIELAVLSPGHDQLADLRRKWPEVVTEGGLDPSVAPPAPEPAPPPGLERMGGLDLEGLASRPTPTDDAAANGSSIVLLAGWAKRSCLLAGDAHPDVLLAGLNELVGEEKILEVDVFKVPHHGSKANVTAELMAKVKASVYVFSTNGKSRARHPNDEAVARVILSRLGEDGYTLAFNYANQGTLKWGEGTLTQKYGYSTLYPSHDMEDGHIMIDLMKLSPVAG